MAFKHNITVAVSGGSTTGVSKSVELTGNVEKEFSVSLNAGQADKLVDVSFTAANLKSFYALATTNVTLETNNATTPADTLNLKANVPYFWHASESQDRSNPFSANVTAFYLTNGDASNASTVEIRILHD